MIIVFYGCLVVLYKTLIEFLCQMDKWVALSLILAVFSLLMTWIMSLTQSNRGKIAHSYWTKYRNRYWIVLFNASSSSSTTKKAAPSPKTMPVLSFEKGRHTLSASPGSLDIAPIFKKLR